MTTTGGPEQFIADPATSDERAGYPIVIGRDADRLPGDDIVVEPQISEPPRARSFRALLLTAVALGLVAGGIAGAVVAYNRGGSDTGASKLSSTQPVQPPAPHPTPRIGGRGRGQAQAADPPEDREARRLEAEAGRGRRRLPSRHGTQDRHAPGPDRLPRRRPSPPRSRPRR